MKWILCALASCPLFLNAMTYEEALLELDTAPKQPPTQEPQQPAANNTWATIRLEDGTKMQAWVPSGVSGEIVFALKDGTKVRGWICK